MTREQEKELKIYIQHWDNKERLIIVCDEGSVFVDITISPNKLDKKAFIWGLNVSPTCRGIGLGNSLLKCAEGCVREQLINKVELEWEASSPLWVYDWYVRSGYKEIDFNEGYSRLCKKFYKKKYKRLNYDKRTSKSNAAYYSGICRGKDYSI